ncbi:DUF2510 domain-containing protein [Nocardia sp. NPDC055321]
MTPPPQTFGPPPGWYCDPTGAVRWFDGRQWTDIVRPPGQIPS